MAVGGYDGRDAGPGTSELPLQTAKSILLFSDGTGNSSAKLFKTNVWRTYEAVDLGPAPPGKRRQIAFYDNGVGTSSFRPLALLGGIFGFGLKRNVLEIYRYACRNYAPPTGEGGDGDEIYGFGFSRGAFTMRLVIALIASQGLVQSRSEEELLLRSEDAYREYRREFLPRRLQAPTLLRRAIRDRISAFLRRRRKIESYQQSYNYRPVIRFVGVWDTVSAYGGPIAEIIRAIDDWFIALSMPNYVLSKRVQCARHALSLDDERDAFKPLVWDELAEKSMRDNEDVKEGRLQQIWFTGMHADVGGGYPDESLSYVSLLWMLEEAGKSDLRTLDVVTDRFRALANSAGPIHDSRSGPGVYYRYQPRRLDGLLETPHPDTRIQWEPERARMLQPRGLLLGIDIHESVAARIASGTDRYAPVTLPERFRIVPPQKHGEASPQADNQTPTDTDLPKYPVPTPILSAEDYRSLTDPQRASDRVRAMERVWDLVWWRRVVYFASLASSLLLFSMPLWRSKSPLEALCDDDRCWLPGVFSPVKALAPEFLAPWLDAFSSQPIVALLLIGTFLLLAFHVAPVLESRIHARTFSAWRSALGDGRFELGSASTLSRRLRRSTTYITFIRFLKWRFLPGAVAVSIVWAMVVVGGAALTQSSLVISERGDGFCGDGGTSAASAPDGAIAYQTARPCQDLGVDVAPGERYALGITVTQPWTDGQLAADPERGVVDRLPIYLTGAGLYRRVVSANWMKPLLVTKKPGRVRIDVLELHHVKGSCYVGELTTADSGRLHLAVNDAALPLTTTAFYGNNGGSAVVRIINLRTSSEASPCS